MLVLKYSGLHFQICLPQLARIGGAVVVLIRLPVSPKLEIINVLKDYHNKSYKSLRAGHSEPVHFSVHTIL